MLAAKEKGQMKATEMEEGLSRAPSAELLDIYLKESGAYPVLPPKEQDRLLRELIEKRNEWQSSFLDTEPALEAVWEDLQRFRCGEIAASSLVPGPPRLAEGQVGPNDHVENIYKLFEKHRARRKTRPFRQTKTNPTRKLVDAILHVGFRPRPMARYEKAAREFGTAAAKRRIQKKHEAFLEVRRVLVEHNLRLVLKVARQFYPGPLPLPDLVQEGNIGLIRATESFNLRFGVRFSTYAHLWIRQAIIRALEDKSRTIRLPVSVTQKLRRLRIQENEQPESLTSGEKDQLRHLLSNPTIGGPLLSLNSAADEEGDALAEIVPDENPPHPESQLAGNDLRRVIRTSLDVLPERERLVLKLRFGLDGARPHTLGRIGDLLGLSAERVRQIQENAFKCLRSGPDGSLLEELVLD